jgi:hypothetical protein
MHYETSLAVPEMTAEVLIYYSSYQTALNEDFWECGMFQLNLLRSSRLRKAVTSASNLLRCSECDSF